MSNSIIWEKYLNKDLARASESDVKAVEGELGRVLPESLKKLMMEHGGETPVNLSVRYPNGKEMALECLYHAHTGQSEVYTTAWQTPNLAEQGYENLVPFADSAGSVFLCLDYSVREKDPPVVMLFRGYMTTDPDHKRRLAYNFDEFLKKYTV
ncbi:MAG: SMI1/KNR4 family protein [Gammaproteobacteria bacterium]|nr:SMI1/KNR4 family protein [Gammaproteobacteria bacterium]